MENLIKQREKFGKLCGMYWRADARQVMVSRLEGGQCLVGSSAKTAPPTMALYDICDCDMLASEILRVGAPTVRIITYRNGNGTLTVPSTQRILGDMRADFQKQRSKWNRRNGKGSQGR